MSEAIVPQDEVEVKCTIEWCEEPEFREGLCWFHFNEEKIAEWNDQDAERQTCREGVGYIFGDAWDPALDGAWHGYAVEEVYNGI